MREIKFRLRIGNKILGYEQWYIGDGGNSHWEYLKVNDTVWRPDFIYHTQKDQYTGLKDKNGKEIYEGDIVEFRDGFPLAVIFKLGNYVIGKYTDMLLSKCFEEIKIIGNIYENPELLK